MTTSRPEPSQDRGDSRRRGKAAVDQMFRGVVQQGSRPLVFLDFDDTICIGEPYGGFDVFESEGDTPADLWEKLWHPPAARVITEVVDEFKPQVVLTTSWLRLLPRDGFVSLFHRTGLGLVAESLHPAWDAPQTSGTSRHHAIQAWLQARYEGQPFVVLDDHESGTGLASSRLHSAGRVVLCEVGVGLHAGHLPAIRRALGGVPAELGAST